MRHCATKTSLPGMQYSLTNKRPLTWVYSVTKLHDLCCIFRNKGIIKTELRPRWYLSMKEMIWHNYPLFLLELHSLTNTQTFYTYRISWSSSPLAFNNLNHKHKAIVTKRNSNHQPIHRQSFLPKLAKIILHQTNQSI